MKIVVFGPEKRVGALHGEHVVDLSLAFAKFVKERQDERQPMLLAAAIVPSDLALFIEGGARTLGHAETALDHLFGNVHDQLGANGEHWYTKLPKFACMLHAPTAPALHAPAAILLTISREWRPWVSCPAQAPCRSMKPPPGSGTQEFGASGKLADTPRVPAKKCLTQAGRIGSIMKVRSQSFSTARQRMFARPTHAIWSGA